MSNLALTWYQAYGAILFTVACIELTDITMDKYFKDFDPLWSFLGGIVGGGLFVGVCMILNLR